MKKVFAILAAAAFSLTAFAQATAQATHEQHENAQAAFDRAPVAAPAAQASAKQEEESQFLKLCASKVACYVPNLIMDCLDMTSLDLKSGLYSGLGFRLTRIFGIGAEGGVNVGLYKDINRQYGFAYNNGYQLQAGFLTMEDTSVFDPAGTVKPYWVHGDNFPSWNSELYAIDSGARDYWAIEVYAYLLAGAKVGVHPIEIADFITGIFFYDLKGDDLKLKIY